MNKKDWKQYRDDVPRVGQRVFVLHNDGFAPFPFADLMLYCEYQWDKLAYDFKWVILRTGEMVDVNRYDYWCAVNVPERW